MPLTMARNPKERAMPKVENKSQVVKKEIIKISLADPGVFTGLENLTDPTYKVLLKLSFLIGTGRMGLEYGFNVKDTVQYSFQEIADLSCNIMQTFDVDMVRNAMSELISKGYLIRDTDGCLAFAPTGSMQ